ncbi:MAG: molybdenum cofactor guanylyltransferase [Lachnospiraceae bacterium]|nr:molybdenum cofactor guanylyltransferase [Lachnospiraceae bacterium]
MDRIAMVLLTGGNSTRMGTSKAELVLDGQTFAERIAEELAACGPLYLSVSADTPHVPLHEIYPCIRDEADHVGPMGGISAVFHQIDADACFFCACDMPFMARAYVSHLCGIWDSVSPESYDALLVKGAGGRIYPTAGIYHRRILKDLDLKIQEENYRLRDLLASHRVFYVEENSLGELKKSLINVNTIKDYESLRDH